jgi:ABC-type glycerol-3-phosphate transport system substrate-binding protein
MMPIGTPENQLAAWIFIHWFTSPEAQVQWVKASNYFSPRYSVGPMVEDYIAGNPKYATALEMLPYAEFEPQLISYAAVRDAVSDAFNEIITGDVTIDDIPAKLAELDELAAELHAESLE